MISISKRNINTKELVKERVHSSIMKTTKGGKVMNPTNAYRKELCEKIIEEAYGVMAYATQVRPGDFIAIGTGVGSR
ncbi:hypothetical protein ACSQ67_000399 [Phaseolus vulgaris]